MPFNSMAGLLIIKIPLIENRATPKIENGATPRLWHGPVI
jgi:hypothetical protein